MTPSTDAIARLATAQVWQATLVIGAVGLLAAAGCRRRPHLAHTLWLVVLVKCLAPPLWSSPTGVFTWAGGGEPEAQRDEPARAASAINAAQDRPEAGRGGPTTAGEPTGGTPVRDAGRTSSPWVAALGVGWLAGAAAYGGFAATALIGWRRRVRETATPTDEALAATAADLARRLGIRRRVLLIVTRDMIGPMTSGWLRPVVVMPRVLVEGRSAEEMEPLLAHELMHVRRGDAAIGLLQAVVQGLWWFHPLVWWANRRIAFERERCCDAEVVAGLSCEPGRYARSLVEVLELKRKSRRLGPGLGVSPFEVTKQRLESIMLDHARFHRKTPRGCWLVLIAGILLTVPGAARRDEGRGPEFFLVLDSGTAILDANGKEIERLERFDGAASAVSPDGRWMAFSEARPSETPGRFQNSLILLHRDEPRERRSLPFVWGTTGSSFLPVWSGDGKRLLICEQGWNPDSTRGTSYRVYDLDAKTLTEMKAPDDCWASDWSSDGSRLVTSLKSADGVARIALVSVDGSGKREFVTSQDDVDYFGARLSPDGRRLLCLAMPRAPKDPVDRRLCVVDVATQKRTIVDEPGVTDGYRWSTDGTKIAYTWQRPLDKPLETPVRETFLITCNPDASDRKVVTSRTYKVPENSSGRDGVIFFFQVYGWRR